MQSEITAQRYRVRHPVDPDPLEVIPPDSIVVGIDGSEGSAAALAWALDEAGRRQVDVDAVLTWEDAFNIGRPTPISALAKPQRKRLQARLDTVLTKAEHQVGLPAGIAVRTHIFSASPLSLLASLSERADLLVVGARGYGALRGSLLGSVSQHLSRTASGTTVIVRGQRPLPLPAGQRRQILVGLDGSPGADAALAWARQTALESGDQLVLVHSWGGMVGLGMEAPVAEQLSDIGRDLLDQAAARLIPSGLDVAARLDFGPPEATLVQLSGTHDLLVVGSRGRGSLAGLLLGSVSQHCVTNADCPVAVVHSHR